MAKVNINLSDISTGYSLFEQNQVLTHDQLNQLSAYFEDQDRLTRVKLIGAGIVCGLNLSKAGNTIRLSKGIGLTTDGDLVNIASDIEFEGFVAYDEQKPIYDFFYNAEEMLPLYELVPKGKKVEGSELLSVFESKTAVSFNNAVAVLYVENYCLDTDMCTSTDCDNLGQEVLNTIKILLLDRKFAPALRKNLPPGQQPYFNLPMVVAERVVLTTQAKEMDDLESAYNTVCLNIINSLKQSLPKIYAETGTLLPEVFKNVDPSGAWLSRISEQYQKMNGGGKQQIQYFYDYLKDLVASYEALREELYDWVSYCCPEVMWFPKHLLLGTIGATGEDENRFGFYGSPLQHCCSSTIEKIRFSVEKISALILSYEVPSNSGTAPVAIKVTPSRSEEYLLAERAIPYYYNIGISPVQKYWNYNLSQRKKETSIYSYNAGKYGATGAALQPLKYQLGPYSFFKIEGHLGQNVTTALNAVEKIIADNNLPIQVKTILIHDDHSKVVPRPGRKANDWYNWHKILRTDLYYNMDNIASFSDSYKRLVEEGVSKKIIDKPATGYATRFDDVKSKANKVKQKVSGSHEEYRSNTDFQKDVADISKNSAQFKKELKDYTYTSFSTPYDKLVEYSPIRWIDWVDVIIDDLTIKDRKKSLFSNFIKEHPGMEHLGGSYRGGTFILVYDADNKNVVADFTLPYYLLEEKEQESPQEPNLGKTNFFDDWTITNGIDLDYSIPKVIDDKINIYKQDWIKDFETRINYQDKIFDIYKLGIDFGKNITPGKVTPGLDFDSAYDDLIRDITVGREQTKYYEDKVNSGIKLTQEEEIKYRETEKYLADKVNKSVQLVNESGKDISSGDKGTKLLDLANDTTSSFKLKDTKDYLSGKLSTIQIDSNKTNLGGVLKNIGTKLK